MTNQAVTYEERSSAFKLIMEEIVEYQAEIDFRRVPIGNYNKMVVKFVG